MPTVKVSTKHPGGRWRTGRQFGPDEVSVDVTSEELSRLLADPVLRVVTLDGGPHRAACPAVEEIKPEKHGLESETDPQPGPQIQGGTNQQQQQQKRR